MKLKSNEVYINARYQPNIGKFYYRIRYRENGVWYEGFGSYFREYVEKWVKEYVIIEN